MNISQIEVKFGIEVDIRRTHQLVLEEKGLIIRYRVEKFRNKMHANSTTQTQGLQSICIQGKFRRVGIVEDFCVCYIMYNRFIYIMYSSNPF